MNDFCNMHTIKGLLVIERKILSFASNAILFEFTIFDSSMQDCNIMSENMGKLAKNCLQY